MSNDLYKKVFLTKIVGNYEDVNRIRLLNYCTLIAMTVGIVFAPVNLIQGKPLLAVLNVFTFLVGLTSFYLNRNGNSHTGFLLQGLAFSAIAAYSAIRFRNGLENYIILNLCIVILFQRKLWVIFFFSFFNTALYLITVYTITNIPSAEALPFYRRLLNYGLSLLALSLVIRYFKKIYNQFLTEINIQNQKILKQQEELSASKYDLQIKNQELQKFNSAKEKLFSIIAHDVKSPIIGLKSSLDLLNKDIISVDEFKSLSIELAQRVNQLQGNLDNLLQWSQSQMLGITAKPEQCSLQTILLDCLGLLQQNLEIKQIKIETEITNLINIGVGMTQSTTDKIFDALQLNSQYGTANEKGTGLGLQMCKEFLAQNNGKIWVRSELGKGSTFYFSLPKA